MEPRHEQIARIALAAGARYGLALAGGYAVAAHGMGTDSLAGSGGRATAAGPFREILLAATASQVEGTCHTAGRMFQLKLAS